MVRLLLPLSVLQLNVVWMHLKMVKTCTKICDKQNQNETILLIV